MNEAIQQLKQAMAVLDQTLAAEKSKRDELEGRLRQQQTHKQQQEWQRQKLLETQQGNGGSSWPKPRLSWSRWRQNCRILYLKFLKKRIWKPCGRSCRSLQRRNGSPGTRQHAGPGGVQPHPGTPQ